eukprot:2501703-Pyramimonas_sp.AAC.1
MNNRIALVQETRWSEHETEVCSQHVPWCLPRATWGRPEDWPEEWASFSLTASLSSNNRLSSQGAPSLPWSNRVSA